MAKGKVLRIRVSAKLQNRVDQEADNRGMNRSAFIRFCIEKELQNSKEVNIMLREEMIKQMEGEIVTVDGEWLLENDGEMIEWITDSKYWGRGHENIEIKPEDAILEMHFGSRGIDYNVTFEGHPEGVEQSLNNQPPWGEDTLEDWNDIELKTYYNEMQKEKGK